MKIKLTDFALRHFDKTFNGTKILDITPEKFEKKLQNNINSDVLIGLLERMKEKGFAHSNNNKILEGYAPFCKLLAIKNFTDAKVGSLPITLENYQYLRSGYSARRESELPVFSRWLELPLGKPKAEWLMLVLYDKAQIDEEGIMTEGEHGDPNEKYTPLDADWGIVAILGQSHPDEEPMQPATMTRNALGVEEGGSGVTLDRKDYLKSVKFWSENATVK